MQFIRREWIGKVCLKYIGTDRKKVPVYSDGPIENELYRRFKADPNYGQLSKDTRFKSWAEEYHLSPVRHNLLKWFPFDPDRSVFEVGAGCGALTGLLCSKLKKVTALEYSYRRALVTAQRHSKRSNLDVIVGGLQDFECEEQFDYITVIGVLEYAGTFYGGKNPYKSFLTKLRQMLKSDGSLILAIENKIGLKYITGAPEDHTGRVFESIYNYPSANKIRTFCKKELTDILHSTGFCNLNWYYPLPDYKLPQIILSDDTPPNDSDSVWSLCPAPTGGHRRMEVISERMFGKTLAQAGLFGEFANSFLVIAKTQYAREDLRCLHFFEGAKTARKPLFRTDLTVVQRGKEKFVIKSSATEAAKPFIRLIAQRERDTAEYLKGNFEVLCGKLEGDYIEYDYLPYTSLKDMIISHMQQGDANKANALFQTYVERIRSLRSVKTIPEDFYATIAHDITRTKRELTCLRRGLVDLTPRNILVDGDRWIALDNEWSFDFPVPTVFILFRAIMKMTTVLQSEIRNNTQEQNPAIGLFRRNLHTYYVPVAWIKQVPDAEISFSRLLCWEFGFQKYVTGSSIIDVRRIKMNAKIKTHFPTRSLSSNIGIVGRVAHFLKKIPLARRLVHFFEHMLLYLQIIMEA